MVTIRNGTEISSPETKIGCSQGGAYGYELLIRGTETSEAMRVYHVYCLKNSVLLK
jgi:hypothetical protein